MTNPKDTALVLEGGGLRGVYTSGVLRYFMDRNLKFPYVIGVSMGACNGANYVSMQPERNRIVNIRYANDGRYLSYTRLLLDGELFGMRFLFDSIPNKLVPFDFETFRKSEQRFVAAATDCETGEPVYFDKDRPDGEMMTVLQVWHHQRTVVRLFRRAFIASVSSVREEKVAPPLPEVAAFSSRFQEVPCPPTTATSA